MQRIHKHWIGILFLYLLNKQEHIFLHGAILSSENQTGLLGNNTVTLSCMFTLETGETALTLAIRRKRSSESSFVEVVQFDIRLNRTSYSDPSLKERSSLILLGDSGSLRFNDVQCSDEATYQCLMFYFGDLVMKTIEFDMHLVVEANPYYPVMPTAYNPINTTFSEYEELEVRCEGDVGLPAGNFVWFGYQDGNHHVDFTSLANQSEPVRNDTGSRSCVFSRESKLKINLTRVENNLVIRCVVNHTTLKLPQPSDICDPVSCVQTDPINVEYPIRQEDLRIITSPPGSEYDVGSDVTLTCSAVGNPPPYFRWEKDGDENITFEGQDSWTLTDIQQGHSGTYRCHAYNNVSDVTYTASRAINITVRGVHISEASISLGTGIAISVGTLLSLVALCIMMALIVKRRHSGCLSDSTYKVSTSPIKNEKVTV